MPFLNATCANCSVYLDQLQGCPDWYKRYTESLAFNSPVVGPPEQPICIDYCWSIQNSPSCSKENRPRPS